MNNMKRNVMLTFSLLLAVLLAITAFSADYEKPGQNILTGSAEQYTFEDGTIPSIIKTTFTATVNAPSDVVSNPYPQDSLNSSEKVFHVPVYSSTFVPPTFNPARTDLYPNVIISLEKTIDGGRPVYVSFDYLKTYEAASDETPDLRNNLWILKNGTDLVAYGSETDFAIKGKWSNYSGFPSFSAASGVSNGATSTGDLYYIGIQARARQNPGTTHIYYDNITVIPSYRIAYYMGDGTDDIYSSEYFLFDGSGEFFTEYDADLTKEPSRYGYFFRGWSLSDGGEVLSGNKYHVSLSGEDIELYAIWEEDPDAPEPTEAVYDFENGESQVFTGSGVTYKYGILNADVSSSIEAPLSLDTKSHRYLAIQLKNPTEASSLTFSFTTSVNESESAEQSVTLPIAQNSETFREYSVDLSQNAYWKGDSESVKITFPGEASGNIQIEKIAFSTLYEQPEATKIASIPLSEISEGFNTVQGSYNEEDGTFTIVKSAAGGGAIVTPSFANGDVPIKDYPYLIFKAKKSDISGVNALYIYFSDFDTSYVETYATSTSKTEIGDYVYFYINWGEKLGSAFENSSYKSFMIAPVQIGTVKIEDVLLANTLDISEDNIEKFALYADKDAIVTDGGEVTVTPYIRNVYGKELGIEDVVYASDSIDAVIEVNADNTVTLTAKRNGRAGVTASIESLGVIAKLTIDVTNQSDRIVAQKLKWISYGNSIHFSYRSAIWPGMWGMAASAEDKDYVHRLWYYLEQKYGEGTVEHVYGEGQKTIEFDISSYEDGYDFTEYLSGLTAFMEQEKPDIVTLQYGDNGGDISAEKYKSGMRYLVNAVKKGAPDAIVLVTTTFWPGYNGKYQGIHELAEEMDLPLADISIYGGNDEYEAMGLFGNEGVQHHPGDKGMDAIASTMYDALNIYLTKDFDKNIVYSVNPTDIEIETDVRTITADGGTLDLEAKIYPLDASQDMVFTSSDEHIATVDKNGVVRAVGNGEVTISVSSSYVSDLSASVTLTISGQTPFHTVYFDKNTSDTVTNMPSSDEYAKGEYPVPAVFPERAKYKFIGWAESPDGKAVSSITVTEDTTLYAIWETAYSWDFNTNGNLHGFVVINGFNTSVIDGHLISIATETNEQAGNILTFISPELYLDSSVYDILKIRMSNSVVGTGTTLRLTVNTDSGDFSFTSPVKGAGYTTYTFDLSKLSGIITGFSFKPTDIDCSMYIDNIAFEKSSDKPLTSTCTVDGTSVSVNLAVNMTPFKNNATAVIAFYGSDGRLQDMQTESLEAGKVITKTLTKECEAAPEKVRLFVLEDSTLIPLLSRADMYDASESTEGDKDLDTELLD